MKPKFTFKTPEDSTGFLLWKVSNHWRKLIAETLKPFKLSHPEFVVLTNIYYLSHSTEDVTQVDLAKQTGLDKMRITLIIKSLLEKKYTKQAAHKTDTRAKTVHLTPAGEKFLAKVLKEIEDVDTIFFSELKDRKYVNLELVSLLK